MSDLTHAQRIDRGERAKRAVEEFIAPEFERARLTYSTRIAEVAAGELNPALRSDKITALALAVRVLNEVESSIVHAISDGEAVRSMLDSVSRLEKLSDAQRRLIAVAG